VKTRRLFLAILFAARIASAQGGGSVRDEEIKFQSGHVTLAGVLSVPSSTSPLPAIILNHGARSGYTREFIRPFVERFTHDGLAVLIYDKRGTGGSGGHWTDASLEDQADDAIAAAKFLRTRKEVDASRIGLWGVSHAGWVIPRAIAKAPDAFAFALVITGGGTRAVDVERFDYKQMLAHSGTSEAERAEAMALVERYFEYLRTGNDRPGLVAAIEAATAKPWGKVINLNRSLPDETARAKWEWVVTYARQTDISSIKIPILVIFGGQDRPGLVETAEENWRSALGKAHNQDATLLFFPAAGHGIVMGGHRMSGPLTYAPGYHELVDAWLVNHAPPKPSN
jgi:uncharacterized protein